jgi:hypothetical protein
MEEGRRRYIFDYLLRYWISPNAFIWHTQPALEVFLMDFLGIKVFEELRV